MDPEKKKYQSLTDQTDDIWNLLNDPLTTLKIMHPLHITY